MSGEPAQQHPNGCDSPAAGNGADTATGIVVDPDPSRWSVLVNSAWHWDLRAALVVGGVVAVVVGVASVAPSWWWAAPVAVVSVWLSILAASEYGGLQIRLANSRYGALIRVTDPTEIKFRMPYAISVWVSLGAVACCVCAAVVFATTDNRPLDVVVSAGTSLLAAWAAFCVVSLVRLHALHEKLSAEADSMPEIVDRYIAEHQTDEPRTGTGGGP